MAPQLSGPSLSRSRSRKQRSSETSGREDYSFDLTTEPPSPVGDRKKRKSGGSNAEKQKKRNSCGSSAEKQKRRDSISDDDLIPVQPKRRRRRKDIAGGADLRNSDFTFGPSYLKNLRKLPSRNQFQWFDDSSENIENTVGLKRVPSQRKQKSPTLSSSNTLSEVPESKQDKTLAESNGSVIISTKKPEEKEPPTDAPRPLLDLSNDVPFPVPAAEPEKDESSPSNLTIAMSDLKVEEQTLHTQALRTVEETCDDPINLVGIREHTLQLETTMSVAQIGECNETKEVTEVINPQDSFTIEGMFDWLLPRAAEAKASSQLLLADILRRDNIFLILMERHKEILKNSYLMTNHTTEELFRLLLNSLQALVQGELREIITSYHQVLDLFN